MPYSDPIAQGIQGFVSNYMAKRKLDEEIKLRQLQEAERAQKIAEAEEQKSAAQNLSNIVAMRSGNWPMGRTPKVVATSPDINAPGLVNVPEGGSMEGEQVVEKPSQQYLQASLVNEKQALAKKSPDLFFKQMGLESNEAKAAMQRDRIKAQTARLRALTQRTEDMSKWESSGLGLALKEIKEKQTAQANAMLIGDEIRVAELSDEIDSAMESAQGFLTTNKPGLNKLFPNKKKKVKAPPEVLDALNSGAAKKVKKNGIIWQLDAQGSPVQVP